MKKLFLLTLILAVSAIAAVRTTGVLSWDYPASEVSNVTFNVYSSTNLTNWVLVSNVSGTNATVQLSPGNGFWFVTASNEFGESVPSNNCDFDGGQGCGWGEDKMRILGIMGVMLAPLLAVAQMPPAPPGFVTSPKRAILSPKHLGNRSGAQMIRPTIPTLAPLTIPTNHAPPVAVIRWAFSPDGSVEIDPALTNPVPILMVRDWELGQPVVGIQWIGVAGKIYEIQFMFDGFGWLTYMRLTADSDGVKTGWCAISPKERSRFFRVRSN